MASAANSMKLLRIALEVIQSQAVDEEARDAATGELGLVLQVSEQIGQLDVGLVQRDGRAGRGFGREHSGLADGEVGLANLQAGLADGRGVPQRLGTIGEQLVVVEIYPVSGLVLDAIPQRFETFALQYDLPSLDLDSFVGVLYLQLPGQFAQNLLDLR